MSSATDLSRRAFLGTAAAASASLATAATKRDWTGVNPTRYPDPDIVTLDPRQPAASAQDGFEATVSVLKASEAVAKKSRIVFSKEWFQI